MSSRYYRARPGYSSWVGVCEVEDGQESLYRHHSQWPQRTNTTYSFDVGEFVRITDPETGHWVLTSVDPDLDMDVGL